jgi:hypothetical protein
MGGTRTVILHSGLEMHEVALLGYFKSLIILPK